MKQTLTLLAGLLLAGTVSAQLSFTDNTTKLGGPYYSGGVVGVVDMNGDRMDDIIIFDEAKNVYIEYQNVDGTFSTEDYGQISSASQWGAAVGDVDGDGHKDIFSGGSYDGVHCMLISSPGNEVITQLNNGNMFMQCANMADIDNDGWIDAFGCHDDAESKIWINDGAGLLLNQTPIDFTTNPVSDMSGNYGSCWTDVDNDGDIDLHIAKCRQFVNDPTDPRRINVLYINDGNGNYTNEAGIRGIDLGDQSWSSDFGDIDNDGDLDHVVVNHDNTIRLFENDGNGFFTEITAGSGLEVTGFFLQSIMRDFDNDGFLDLLCSGGANYLFMGNGDGTFTDNSTVIATTDLLHSFGLGDLNSDGFIDYYASYGETYVGSDPNNPDKLWLNDGNANNWAAFELQGTTSNVGAIGTQTRIYGPWGVQMREVRSGESYGIFNSFTANYGLGAETMIDSLVINWPSGLVETYYNISAGAYYTAVEGNCLAPDFAVTYNAAAPIVCTGGTPLTITADAGFTYLWNTGDTTQAISVSAGGIYTVTIDDGTGCTNSMSINVQQDPDETPTIISDGGTVACDGDIITLSTNSTTPLSWSNGDTSSSIQVTQTSTVSVSTVGVCGTYTSTQVSITFTPTPAMPTTTGDNLAAAGPGMVTATGTDIQWFDAQTGGNLLGTGSPWTTPTVALTQSFWAQDVASNAGPITNGGKLNNDLSFGGYYNNNNRLLVFDAYESFTIESVKVYANGAGVRSFEILELASGNQIAAGTFNLIDGEQRVNVNFYIPGPGEYTFRSVTSTPNLWRDSNGSNPSFPFQLGTVGAITRSNANASTDFYYFFYDWEVAAGNQCVSPRAEAVVQVSVGVDELFAGELEIWPNPSSGLFNLQVGGLNSSLNAAVYDVTGRVVNTTLFSTSDISNGTLILNLEGLAKGEYLLELSAENGRTSKRLVVQ